MCFGAKCVGVSGLLAAIACFSCSSIVGSHRPETLVRWHRARFRRYWAGSLARWEVGRQSATTAHSHLTNMISARPSRSYSNPASVRLRSSSRFALVTSRMSRLRCGFSANWTPASAGRRRGIQSKLACRTARSGNSPPRRSRRPGSSAPAPAATKQKRTPPPIEQRLLAAVQPLRLRISRSVLLLSLVTVTSWRVNACLKRRLSACSARRSP
jgi:hypothetical protein